MSTFTSPTSPYSPTSLPEVPRPSSRAARADSPKPGKSRTRTFLSSVSRSRSRPGTPDLTPCLVDELPRRSQSHDAMTQLSTLEKMSSTTTEYSLRPSTRETQHTPADWRQDRQHSGLARSLLHKSSRLLQKRKSSNRLRAQTEWVDESDSTVSELRDTHLSPRSRHYRGTSHVPELLKQSISDPYNFQHVTHTNAAHARSLQTTTSRDLVTEFSAIRASQAPKAELRGIKASSIQNQAEPFPSLVPTVSNSTEPASPTTSRHTSRPTSRAGSRATSRPTTPRESTNQGTTSERPSLRSTKSVDSFTRLASRSFSTPMPPSPPPRRSSRKPLAMQSMIVVDAHIAQSAPNTAELRSPTMVSATSSSFASSVLSSPTDDGDMESLASPQEEIAQAVTTPDDSACMLMSKPPSTPPSALEGVPEEEETSVHEAKDSRQIRHTKSFPSARHFSRIISPGVNNEAAASDPTLPRLDSNEDIPTEHSRRMSRRVSNQGGKAVVESWEDGVDFCYEHAMDDDMYDWDGEYEDGLSLDREATPQAMNTKEDLYLSIPELKADSTKSASSSAVTVPGIVTPSEPSSQSVLTVPRDSNGSAIFTLSPSLLIPTEYTSRVTHEDTYTQKLNASDYKSNYTFFSNFDPDQYRDYSPRSSAGTPLTKSSSRDSLAVSRSGSVATRATSHRHSGSIGSIPELVSGKPANRERLAEHTTSEGINVDALRQRFITAADSIPHEQIEAASMPGTPLKTPGTPIKASSRSRANSVATEAAFSVAANLPAAATKVQQSRMRSASLANSYNTTKPKGHRTSYSLFPQTSAR